MLNCYFCHEPATTRTEEGRVHVHLVQCPSCGRYGVHDSQSANLRALTVETKSRVASELRARSDPDEIVEFAGWDIGRA